MWKTQPMKLFKSQCWKSGRSVSDDCRLNAVEPDGGNVPRPGRKEVSVVVVVMPFVGCVERRSKRRNGTRLHKFHPSLLVLRQD